MLGRDHLRPRRHGPSHRDARHREQWNRSVAYDCTQGDRQSPEGPNGNADRDPSSRKLEYQYIVGQFRRSDSRTRQIDDIQTDQFGPERAANQLYKPGGIFCSPDQTAGIRVSKRGHELPPAIDAAANVRADGGIYL